MAQEPFGNRTADVYELQGFLRRIARDNQRIPLIALDGIFGPETTEAVSAFQREYDLPVTGTVDFNNWNTILDEYLRLVGQTSSPLPIYPFPSPQYVVKPGDKGDLIYIIQIMLDTIQVGFLNLYSGGFTGVYDDKTQRAVEAVQRGAGLKPTGLVDRITWDILARSYNYRIHADR
ncbi:Putative peptidoglycan binding domain protein [Eubacteriaceae bacterium CHKCI005]|nr:Putative peptidoglycan binding domain protein [Eubacteriaceae bacterium CHKCI005]